MTEPLRLMIARAPQQGELFRVGREQLDAALSRCRLPLPPIDIAVRETTDAEFGELLFDLAAKVAVHRCARLDR